MKPKTRKEKPTIGREGIYYVVPFLQGWRVLPACLVPHSNADLGHPQFWEEFVAGALAKEWHPQVFKQFSTSEELRTELLPLVYAFPRGRVVRLGSKFAIYHGQDLESFMQSDLKAIETCFNIQGRAEWRIDDHEQCLILDKERVRELLQLQHDWNAV